MKLQFINSHFIITVFLTLSIFWSLLSYAEPSYFFRCINSIDGLPEGYVRDITSDNEGYIYIFTDKGLYRYDGNKVAAVTDSCLKNNPALYKNSIPYSTSHESKKTSFIASDGDVWVYDSFGYGLESHDSGKKFFRECIIKDIDEDAQGNLWIATNNNGIIVFNAKTKEYSCLQHDSSISHSLPTNHTTCVFIDSISSTAWIGTSNDGVAVTSLLKPELKVYKTGVGHDVSCFTITPDNRILIGYDGGGLFDAAGIPIDIPANVVTNLRYNPIDDVTYIATYGDGIFTLRGNKVESLPECGPESLAAFSRQMVVGPDGDLWIGTFSNGLIRHSVNGSIKQFRTDAFPLGSNCIVGLDRYGETLFIASTAGLCSLDLKNMTFKRLPLIDNVTIRAFKLDRNGRAWVATDRNVITPDFQKLPIANTRALTFDDDNNCWISTADGLNVVLPPTDKLKDYRYYYFPVNITGATNGFSKYSIFTKPDGRILVGSFGTYLEFSPSDLVEICKSSLKVSSVYINHKLIPFSNKIALQRNDTLEIDFGSQNYVIPQNGRLGYRLLPDTTLHLIEHSHLSLTGLPFGNNELQLIELNSGDTSDIEIKIKRPLSFYLYILVALLIVVAIGFLLYFKYFKKPRRPENEGLSSVDRQFIDQLETILERELGNAEFSVETFATEMGMSRSNFYKRVSQLMEKSPLEFVRDRRIEKGKQLLDEGHSHIGQVAYAVGLSPKQFSKFFKEKYGTLPSEYIKPSK